MTDLTPELGPSATCPNCGAQVAVPGDDDAVVTCPDCGHPVAGGWRDNATSDLTNHELLRAFGVRGYLTDVVVVEPGTLRCDNCGTVTEPGSWGVDDLQPASNMTDQGVSESAVVALRCPSCGEMGRVELKLRGPDASPDDRVHEGLLQVWDRQGGAPPA